LFAGNPLLISPELLLREGLLVEAELDLGQYLPRPSERKAARVDFARLLPSRLSLLDRAFERFEQTDPVDIREEFAVFRASNAKWLEDFSLFMALKEAHGGGSWLQWPISIRAREAGALAEARRALGRSIERFAFFQFLFFRHWSDLREHAHRQGIQIIGDMPIFAAEDSSDVWAHQELFCLDPSGFPTVVAGVPPDYFSPTGQLWGNPLYNWPVHSRSGYAWWLERLQATLAMVDLARVDHFRGLAAYWEIPAGNPTAEIGRWVRAPGEEFLSVVSQHLGSSPGGGGLPLIAEDLGVITPDVVALRDGYDLPGMRILQFGFAGPKDPFLPHNYVRNCVAYTGTHDNDTTRGWFETAPERESRFALRYLHSTPRHIVWDMIRALWSSVAGFAITPMQDLLGLGSTARMNHPSLAAGNWEWRMREADVNEALAAQIRELNAVYAR
jgi:4-alpha-glucanotransferase